MTLFCGQKTAQRKFASATIATPVDLKEQNEHIKMILLVTRLLKIDKTRTIKNRTKVNT